MENHQTIYQQLGDDTLMLLLRNFYDKVFTSSVIGHMFTKTSKDEILDKQYCFLTQFLGGPLRYTEKYGHPRMRERHLAHPINTEARDEWLRLMKAAIEQSVDDPQLQIALYNCFPAVANHMVNR
ncbi:MAG: globin [Crocinitomicaceae bacterium]|nr:globin [Crocinitomicaceae bacterium]MBK8926900.1 globin [Crocinitomicaceae bacterium]